MVGRQPPPICQQGHTRSLCSRSLAHRNARRRPFMGFRLAHCRSRCGEVCEGRVGLWARCIWGFGTQRLAALFNMCSPPHAHPTWIPPSPSHEGDAHPSLTHSLLLSFPAAAGTRLPPGLPLRPLAHGQGRPTSACGRGARRPRHELRRCAWRLRGCGERGGGHALAAAAGARWLAVQGLGKHCFQEWRMSPKAAGMSRGAAPVRRWGLGVTACGQHALADAAGA